MPHTKGAACSHQPISVALLRPDVRLHYRAKRIRAHRDAFARDRIKNTNAAGRGRAGGINEVATVAQPAWLNPIERRFGRLCAHPGAEVQHSDLVVLTHAHRERDLVWICPTPIRLGTVSTYP